MTRLTRPNREWTRVRLNRDQSDEQHRHFDRLPCGNAESVVQPRNQDNSATQSEKSRQESDPDPEQAQGRNRNVVTAISAEQLTARRQPFKTSPSRSTWAVPDPSALLPRNGTG